MRRDFRLDALARPGGPWIGPGGDRRPGNLRAGGRRPELGPAGVNPADIEMAIVGTTTPDVLWPTTACLVQNELKLPMVASFDLYAAETSLLAAHNVGIGCS